MCNLQTSVHVIVRHTDTLSLYYRDVEKLYPQDDVLRQFINYYWVIDKTNPLVEYGKTIFEFPSLSPELVIGLEGFFTFTYKSVSQVVYESTLFAYIDDKICVDFSSVRQVVIVRFQPLGLAAFMPFTSGKAHLLRKQSIVNAKAVMTPALTRLEKSLDFANPSNLVDQLDNWFKNQFQRNKGEFLSGIFQEIDTNTSVQGLAKRTGLSYSTLERRFNQESGISPKQFFMLNRFRHAINAIHSASDKDWFDLVVEYGYHDQSHFIKEIKRFSGFTPVKLLSIPRLKTYRPEQAEEFLL